MGFYYINDIAESIVAIVKGVSDYLPLLTLILSVLTFVTVFILQGVGLYTMAKRRGLKYKALAFVPFANIWYIGKLAGDCYFFNHRVKGVGMSAMIMQICTVLLTCGGVAAEVYLRLVVGAPQEGDLGLIWPNNLTGISAQLLTFYEVVGYVLPIVQLVFEIFFIILAMSLYKKYAPKNHMFFSMLTLFIPISPYIIIFAIRNNPAVNYEEYIRAQREAYVRRQQQYYNTYQNSYNRYENGNYGANPSKPDEPFAEFSSQSKGGSPFEEDVTSDGFFD